MEKDRIQSERKALEAGFLKLRKQISRRERIARIIRTALAIALAALVLGWLCSL